MSSEVIKQIQKIQDRGILHELRRIAIEGK